MKSYKITYYILLFSFIWISCEDDKVAPEIQIASPLESSTYQCDDILMLTSTITDDNELDMVEIVITGPDGVTEKSTIDLTGTSQTITREFLLEYTVSGIIKLKLEAFDKCENSKIEEITVEYNYFDSGSIDLNIKLQYDGNPLVIFNTYEYPDGRQMNFTRCSFYTSEMKLDETTINEVEFHNLTNSHSSLELSNEGYNWQIRKVPVGSYNSLSFNIGVPEELNGKDPGEFPSGHPLAKPAENWFSWMSYIFLKIEGNIDLDGDNITETGIAIHTGSDDALRNIQLDYPIQIIQNKNTQVELIFDLYRLFEGQERLFPIEEYPQIHDLSQIDGVIEISNNLSIAIKQ